MSDQSQSLIYLQVKEQQAGLPEGLAIFDIDQTGFIDEVDLKIYADKLGKQAKGMIDYHNAKVPNTMLTKEPEYFAKALVEGRGVALIDDKGDLEGFGVLDEIKDLQTGNVVGLEFGSWIVRPQNTSFGEFPNEEGEIDQVMYDNGADHAVGRGKGFGVRTMLETLNLASKKYPGVPVYSVVTYSQTYIDKNEMPPSMFIYQEKLGLQPLTTIPDVYALAAVEADQEVKSTDAAPLIPGEDFVYLMNGIVDNIQAHIQLWEQKHVNIA